MPDIATLGLRVDSRQVRTATTNLHQFTAQGKKAETQTSKLRKSVAALGITFAVGLALRKVTRDALEFESAMRQSLAIMGDVSEMMEGRMAVAARKVGIELNLGAKEAAQAYFFLASAGFTAEQSVGALATVATFAKAGMFSMALATDLATDAQSALGLKADNAAENLVGLTRVTDVLVKANTLANATVQQFATALTSEAGAALRSFGKDMEEGVAVLAAFADQGVKAEVAGTGLSRILRLMSSAAIKNADDYRRLNVSVFDAAGEMRNIADIVEDLENALGGMSDAERTAALEALGFQARVQGVILPLLGASDAIRGYEKALREAGGTTKEVAEKQMLAPMERLGRAMKQLEDEGISLGQSILIGLVPAMEFAADVVKTLRMELETLSRISAGTSAAAQGILMSLGNVNDLKTLQNRYAEFLNLIPNVNRTIDENARLLNEMGITAADVTTILRFLDGQIVAITNSSGRASEALKQANEALKSAADPLIRLNAVVMEMAETSLPEFVTQGERVRSLAVLWRDAFADLHGVVQPLNDIIADNAKRVEEVVFAWANLKFDDAANELERGRAAFLAWEGLQEVFRDTGTSLEDNMIGPMRELIELMMEAAGIEIDPTGGRSLGAGVKSGAGSALGGQGTLGRIAAGALIGGPAGAAAAFTAALPGLIDGLFGFSRAAEEAAEAAKAAAEAQRELNRTQKEAFDRFASMAEEFSDRYRRALEATGKAAEGSADATALYLERERELAAAREAGGSNLEDLVRRTHAEEDLAIAMEKSARAAEEAARAQEALLRSSEALLARGLAAGGASPRAQFLFGQAMERRTFEGDPALLRLVQAMELAQFEMVEAIRGIEMAFAVQDAAFVKQINIAGEALAVAQDQLRTQERTVAALTQVIESLDDFNRGLLLGNLSTLSPSARLAEARAQFEQLRAAALSGDLSAAAALPAAARAFLEQSRGFNASGLGFVSDFNAVRDALAAVGEGLTAQKSIEERQLEELRAQTGALADQIVILEAAREAARADAEAQIAEIRAAAAAEQAQFLEIMVQWGLALGLWADIEFKDVTLPPPITWPPEKWGDDIESTAKETRAMVGVLSTGLSELSTKLDALKDAQEDTTFQVRRSFDEQPVED